jgi:GGDEF domain-containing protein
MAKSGQNLALNARLLKSKVNKYAVFGVGISFLTIILATILSAYFQNGSLDIEGIIHMQTSNMVLWFLDAMPFIFAILGQYMGVGISYEAGAMVADQTRELRDRTEALEKKAIHGATHDSLTGLPNRSLFRDRVFQALRNAKRLKHKLGVLLLDLDRFKEINDTMGHYNGDRIIYQVAKRIENLVCESDTLARLGGTNSGFCSRQLAGRKMSPLSYQKFTMPSDLPSILTDLKLKFRQVSDVLYSPTMGRTWIF